MFKQILVVSITASCMNFQARPMLESKGPHISQDQFENYIQHGNPRGDQESPSFFDARIQQYINTLENDIPHEFTVLSTPEYAAILPDAPTTEVVAHFTLYKRCLRDFVTDIAHKQVILNESAQEIIPLIDRRILALSHWLTAVRASAEEHYLHECYRVIHNTETPLLHILYNTDNFPLYLNATSMAILRRQFFNRS